MIFQGFIVDSFLFLAATGMDFKPVTHATKGNVFERLHFESGVT